MLNNAVIQRNPKQVFSVIDDEVVMLSIENGEYHNLNSIGADIWLTLSKPMRLNNLINNLTEIYEIDYENCANDVLPFLESLSAKGLITIN